MTQILVIEDDQNLREGLQYNLHGEGYEVVACTSVIEAEQAMTLRDFNLVILDVMLPGEDGYAWCRRMRGGGMSLPVLILTARSLEDDVIRGFEAGAQDYVTKPYRLRELLARVGALIRRGAPPPSQQQTLEFADFALDLTKRTLTRRSTAAPIDLTRTELDLLVYLLRNKDRALTRDDILDEVWGRDLVVDPRTVDNFVSSLKKKLAWSPEAGFSIHTIRGVGYRFETRAPKG